MEVKFASKKKGPAAPKQEPASPPPAAEPAAPAAPKSGEEQFKKLMPLAIIGLLLIIGVLIYIARKKPSSSGTNATVATKGGATTPKRRLTGLRRPLLARPTLTRPRLPTWRDKLFKRSAVVAPTPTRRVAVSGSRRTRPRAARTAPAPTKKAAAPTFCLIFGTVKPGNRALAQKDISKMAKRMRGMIWPAKLKLHTKPCCKVVLGPYKKAMRQKAIKHFNSLKSHYRGRSLSEYNGLLEEIFPPGLGWESCP